MSAVLQAPFVTSMPHARTYSAHIFVLVKLASLEMDKTALVRVKIEHPRGKGGRPPKGEEEEGGGFMLHQDWTQIKCSNPRYNVFILFYLFVCIYLFFKHTKVKLYSSEHAIRSRVEISNAWQPYVTQGRATTFSFRISYRFTSERLSRNLQRRLSPIPCARLLQEKCSSNRSMWVFYLRTRETHDSAR